MSKKHAEYVNMARASVTEENIRKWFEDVHVLLGSVFSILQDSDRVFNTDETAFGCTPKGDLVLDARNESTYDVSSNSGKENITTLVTVNAAGTVPLHPL